HEISCVSAPYAASNNDDEENMREETNRHRNKSRMPESMDNLTAVTGLGSVAGPRASRVLERAAGSMLESNRQAIAVEEELGERLTPMTRRESIRTLPRRSVRSNRGADGSIRSRIASDAAALEEERVLTEIDRERT